MGASGAGVERLHYEVECARNAPRWLNAGRWFSYAVGALAFAGVAQWGWHDGLIGAVVSSGFGLPLGLLATWMGGFWWRMVANGIGWRRRLELLLDAEGGAWRRGQGAWTRLRGELSVRADGALCDGEAVIGWDLHGKRIFEPLMQGWSALRSGRSPAEIAAVKAVGLEGLPEQVKAEVTLDGVKLKLNPARQLHVLDWVFEWSLSLCLLAGPALVAAVARDEGADWLGALGLAVPLGLVGGLIGTIAAILAVILGTLALMIPLGIVGVDLLPDAWVTVGADQVKSQVRAKQRAWALGGLSVQVWLRAGQAHASVRVGRPGAEEELAKGAAEAVLWLGRELEMLARASEGSIEDLPKALEALAERARHAERQRGQGVGEGARRA